MKSCPSFSTPCTESSYKYKIFSNSVEKVTFQIVQEGELFGKPNNQYLLEAIFYTWQQVLRRYSREIQEFNCIA